MIHNAILLPKVFLMSNGILKVQNMLNILSNGVKLLRFKIDNQIEMILITNFIFLIFFLSFDYNNHAGTSERSVLSTKEIPLW